jgi:hypothetical protein
MKVTASYSLDYAKIISTVALLVSLTSFYFTWFYERHSLRLGVPSTSLDEDHYPVTLATNVVLLNGGNRAAVVLSLGLSPESPDAGARQIATEQGPFILKPGEALPVRTESRISKVTVDMVQQERPADPSRMSEIVIRLRVKSVSPSTELLESVMNIGILFEDINEQLVFQPESTKGPHFIDLMSQTSAPPAAPRGSSPPIPGDTRP